MNRCLSLTLTLLAGVLGTSQAQTLVDGTTHPGIFTPPGDVTVTPPPVPDGTLVPTIITDGTASGSLGTYWAAQATGGAVVGLNLPDIPVPVPEERLAETGAQVELTGTALEFNVSNGASILGTLGAGLSLNLSWTATGTFSGTALKPNTIYRVAFDVDTGSGLLQSGLGISPQFGVELLNGAGAPVGSSGGGTVVNILGLELEEVGGAPANTERAIAEFTTGGTVPVGSAGVRFTGSAVLPVAVGTLTNFATVSNLHVYEVDAYTLWIEDSGVTDPEDWDPDADPDQDGRTNIEEFALSTDPANGGHGEAFVAVGDPDGAGPGTSALVMTIAVRENATFSPGTGPNAGDMIAPTTNVDYRVEGSFDLVNWTLAVSEVTTNAPFVAGLPPLQAGWEYRSFRVPGETAATQKAFLRVVFE